METELKFELDAHGAKTLSEHLQLPTLGQAVKLRSVYYDTAETDLRDHGLSLRVRDDGKRRVQTVKQFVPGATGVQRDEWEQPLADGAGDAPDLDAASQTPLGKILSRRELAFVRPVFEVEVKRVTRSVEVEGATIEIALDQGSARAEGRRAAISELELELKAGSPRGLFALARECAAVAPLQLSFLSKAARGYALLDDEPPCPAASIDPPLQVSMSSGAAFQAIAGAALAQISANARALVATRDSEALHQLRVGARRLRSAMSIFKLLLADDAFEVVKAELKWLAGELDEARDLDVFAADVLAPAFARDPDLTGLKGFKARLERARKAAYARALAAVGSDRFRALMLASLAWIEAGDWSLDSDPMRTELRQRPVGALAAEIFQRRRRKIVSKGEDLEAMTPEARHKLRIKAKQLRYACGFFASLYDGRAAKQCRAFTKAARTLQDRLGALTDIAFSRDLAARVAALDEPGDPKPAFAAGTLVGQAAAPMGERLKAAAKAVRALSRADAFW